MRQQRDTLPRTHIFDARKSACDAWQAGSEKAIRTAWAGYRGVGYGKSNHQLVADLLDATGSVLLLASRKSRGRSVRCCPRTIRCCPDLPRSTPYISGWRRCSARVNRARSGRRAPPPRSWSGPRHQQASGRNLRRQKHAGSASPVHWLWSPGYCCSSADHASLNAGDA